jgi:hypothetical protein
MPNLPLPGDNPADPPPVISPYVASRRRALDQAAADRGLDPEPWAA